MRQWQLLRTRSRRIRSSSRMPVALVAQCNVDRERALNRDTLRGCTMPRGPSKSLSVAGPWLCGWLRPCLKVTSYKIRSFESNLLGGCPYVRRFRPLRISSGSGQARRHAGPWY